MPSGAVTSEQAIASQIGTSILASGGSAVDAIIATTLAVNTLSPYHSDIGGGGFAIVREGYQQGGKVKVLDFRQCAPAAATPTLFKESHTSTSIGGLAVAVPGELKGLEILHQKYGKLPWGRLFEESIDMSENGMKVGGDLYDFITRVANPTGSSNMKDTWMSKDPMFSPFINPEGQALAQGSAWTRPEYAKTLRQIAAHGTKAFYEGEIAEALAKTVRERGGVMTVDDLKNYKPIWREPLSVKYKEYTLYAPPAPASGAIWLSAIGMLSQFEPEGYGSVMDLHRLTEALRLAYGQRTSLCDPDYVDGLEAKQHEWLTDEGIQQRASMIDDEKTHEPDYYKPPKVEIVEDNGTSNITAMDSTGLTVSITTTVGLGWGSRIIVPGWGFLLNDSMDDFSVEGRPNGFGYEPQVSNYVAGGKRPLSSSCPYIITDASGKVFASGGAAGGSTIISCNTQVALAMLAYSFSAAQALAANRLHNQILPNVTKVERANKVNPKGDGVQGFVEEQVQGLREKGHVMEWVEKGYSTACTLRWTGETWEAEGEPRKYDSGGSVYHAPE